MLPPIAEPAAGSGRLEWTVGEHGGSGIKDASAPGIIFDTTHLRLNSWRSAGPAALSLCYAPVPPGSSEGEGEPYSPHPYLDVQQRMENLENLIALLANFDNYRLAVLGEEEEELISRTFWQVKWDNEGRHTVLPEARPTSADDQNAGHAAVVGPEILEPTVCRAFREYFIDLFENRISPGSKDKGEIVWFLGAQIDWLRDQAPAQWRQPIADRFLSVIASRHRDPGVIAGSC